MLFHALIPSPLGPILLETDASGLTGLYFTDQKDCPRLAGLRVPDIGVSDPSAGSLDGRPIRTLKPVPAQPALDAGHAPDPAARPSGACADGPGSDDDLQLLQADTPVGALAVLDRTRRELREYWAGKRKAFDVPLAPRGTAFQQRVWHALQAVPCGATLSYGELARQAGLGAGHGRAVGAAVGSNPISILIPCHRILARNGSLNGYGGGLSRKVRLLELEGFELR